MNQLPEDRSKINTRFILLSDYKDQDSASYVFLNQDEIQLSSYVFLNASESDSIAESNFDPGKETKVIIHGFIDTGFVPWIKDMAEALLEYGDFNVVAVDWGGGSNALYSQAASNTRLVGLEVAYLIETLIVSWTYYSFIKNYTKCILERLQCQSRGFPLNRPFFGIAHIRIRRRKDRKIRIGSIGSHIRIGSGRSLIPTHASFRSIGSNRRRIRGCDPY